MRGFFEKDRERIQDRESTETDDPREAIEGFLRFVADEIERSLLAHNHHQEVAFYLFVSVKDCVVIMNPNAS